LFVVYLHVKCQEEGIKKKVEIYLKDHLAAALYDVKGNSSNAAATVSLVAPTKRASTPSEAPRLA